MTAHKAQGKTLDNVVVDLESCRGTEAPYVMLSRVKSIQGLAILRPFRDSNIRCRQSQDVRQEMTRLEVLDRRTEALFAKENSRYTIEVVDRPVHYPEPSSPINISMSLPSSSTSPSSFQHPSHFIRESHNKRQRIR
ncbi:hypothetical protein BDQ17DRAFT_1233446 [Cyathus striatus]|nr:hypothetical protein BDQ17DRAFT_1233446 [Cyathus striatus]